jgi:FSR family fosmidomycin resistance protein-like MFS transporter
VNQPSPFPASPPSRTSFKVLGAISLSHLLNDMIQSLILAIYPLLQSEFSLTFVQIGMITLTFQLASSLLQPVVGYWTDKYPMPWSLPIGMCFTLSGLVLLAMAGSFEAVLIAAALVGTGSSVFHPESSRVARMASGGRHGLAQSLFQVGGNFGSSSARCWAVIIAPYGKGNVAWFVLAALLAIIVLAQISRWYAAQHRVNKGNLKRRLSIPCRAIRLSWRFRAAGADFLEILLYGEHQQLLHLLSDAKIRIIGTKCADPPVCLPVRGGRRYGDWRACGR